MSHAHITQPNARDFYINLLMFEPRRRLFEVSGALPVSPRKLGSESKSKSKSQSKSKPK